jgi:hypothetical protein
MRLPIILMEVYPKILHLKEEQPIIMTGMSLLASHLVIPLAKFRVIVKKKNDRRNQFTKAHSHYHGWKWSMG